MYNSQSQDVHVHMYVLAIGWTFCQTTYSKNGWSSDSFDVARECMYLRNSRLGRCTAVQ